ncbi:maleylacetoacetate isomerase [Rhizobium calliandrae]|uniref:Maleylacetoacetate isomerase n=1 Tax=Rhizobium calliandrae TaxID=1312182 RepID=A0ABT7KPI3_9HYPH|nr:maleylacetoacetate isomerase [Rhizobium calliandrae]MDL2410529.1 maleylacetoacetate isomerase [Rhizobium calliandrae]
MILHGYFRSSAAYRCRIALNLKGIGYESRPIHLRRGGGEQKLPAYLELNPQGLVPTLEVGDLRLTQSLAIIEWLEETYPTPALLPTNKDLRARARAFAEVIACDTHPLQNLRVLDYLKGEFKLDQRAADAWCQHWIGDGLAACEALLAREETGGNFCFGDEPSIADVCLIPQMFSAVRFGVDLSTVPRLQAIQKICDGLPAFSRAHPANQADSET